MMIEFCKVSEKDQAVSLTDKGYDDCDRILGKSMFDPRDPWAPFVINSVKAKELFTRDKVVLVDVIVTSCGAKRYISEVLCDVIVTSRGVNEVP